MHIRIIIGAKLDQIGNLFPEAADGARNLKDYAFAGDDLLIQSQVDSTIQNVAEIHETLENIQAWATAVCDNPEAQSATAVSGSLGGFTDTLIELGVTV